MTRLIFGFWLWNLVLFLLILSCNECSKPANSVFRTIHCAIIGIILLLFIITCSLLLSSSDPFSPPFNHRYKFLPSANSSDLLRCPFSSHLFLFLLIACRRIDALYAWLDTCNSRITLILKDKSLFCVTELYLRERRS